MTNQTTKHCPYCWKKIDENSLYCNYCGKKQDLKFSEKKYKTNDTKKIFTISIISLIVFILGIVATGLIIDYNTSQSTTNINSATTSDTSSVVYITEYGEKYHKKTCRYITESNRIQSTVNKAKKRGYTACSVCKPVASSSNKSTSSSSKPKGQEIYEEMVEYGKNNDNKGKMEARKILEMHKSSDNNK